MMKKEITTICVVIISLSNLSAQQTASMPNGRRIVFTEDVYDHIMLLQGKALSGRVKSMRSTDNPNNYYTEDFDKNGNRLTEDSYIDGKRCIYNHYKYDKNGFLIKAEYMNNGYKYYTNYENDAFGNPMKRLYKEDGEKEIAIFNYDFNKWEVVATDPNAGGYYPRRIFRFDEQGRIVYRQKLTNVGDTITDEYAYNDNGQLVEHKKNISQINRRDQYNESNIETYTYNEQGYWTSIVKKSVSRRVNKDMKDEAQSHPITKVSTTHYTHYQYDAQGNVTSVTIENGVGYRTDTYAYTYYE